MNRTIGQASVLIDNIGPLFVRDYESPLRFMLYRREILDLLIKTSTMKKQNKFTYRLTPLALVIGLLLGASSCYVEQHAHHPPKPHPAAKKPAPAKKSHPAHPHGGPPGQTKKGKGHPGKRH